MKTPAAASERRLRIALLVDRFGNRFGGAEAYGVELMRILSQGHEVTIFARDFDSDLTLPFMPIRSPAWFPSWLRVLHFSWRAHRLTRGRYDIVHSHMNGWAGDVQVMHVTPVRYNRLVRAPRWKRWTAWLSPRLISYLLLERSRVQPSPTRCVVAVSGLIRDQLQRSYGATLPVEIIAPGVKLPAMVEPSERQVIRTKLGWDTQVIGCLLVARNPLRKGLPALLEALAQLPEHYRLLVVGADGPTQERVRAAGAIAQRVTLIAPTPEVAQYFSAADIYAHPTLNDSYGMAPLEAMSHGLPVVVSAPAYCGFAQYLSADKDALILQDPRDGAQLAQALERLGTEPALRAALAARGLAIARAQSWQIVAAAYEALYARIMQAREASKKKGDHT